MHTNADRLSISANFMNSDDYQGFKILIVNNGNIPIRLSAISPSHGVEIEGANPYGMELAPRQIGPVILMPRDQVVALYKLSGLFPELRGHLSVSAAFVASTNEHPPETIVFRGDVDIDLPSPKSFRASLKARRQSGDFSCVQDVSFLLE